jgi:hypothetical protein
MTILTGGRLPNVTRSVTEDGDACYSPECVEGVFCELRLEGVLRS